MVLLKKWKVFSWNLFCNSYSGVFLVSLWALFSPCRIKRTAVSDWLGYVRLVGVEWIRICYRTGNQRKFKFFHDRCLGLNTKKSLLLFLSLELSSALESELFPESQKVLNGEEINSVFKSIWSCNLILIFSLFFPLTNWHSTRVISLLGKVLTS